ncbi:Tn7-like element transposition protein TnsE [Clostridium tagluense]|nr:Tn7-like element transposition protein TnsE [Clostridium tagluense]
MDTFENYFTYEIKARKLDLNFTSEYESKLLKNEKVNHLAWVLTNTSVLRIFNSVGQVIWKKEELKYEFLLDRFNIRARVERKGYIVKILEIISLNKKRINAEEINVYHPSLEESVSSNDTKKRKIVSNNAKGYRELESNADGSTKESDEISTFMINHEYERVPKLNKKKSGRKIIRNNEDKNTKTYILESNNLRTTADTGGENIIKGLEFISLENVEVHGQLEEFVEILMLLRKRYYIKSVDIIIGELQESRNGKRFSRLSDGISKRKYAIGKITMIDGRECSLIEVEREGRALSMLLIKSNDFVHWKKIYSILLLGLVNESGKWSNGEIDKIEKQGILVFRKKHISKSIFVREGKIYYNL